MDRTYNNLVDIVNRTKKINGSSNRPQIPDEEITEEVIEEIVEEEKSPSSLFGENSAIGSFLKKEREESEETYEPVEEVYEETPAVEEVEKPAKKTTAKKTTKKTTTKSTAKKSTAKKSSSKSTTKKSTTKKSTAKKTTTKKSAPKSSVKESPSELIEKLVDLSQETQENIEPIPSDSLIPELKAESIVEEVKVEEPVEEVAEIEDAPEEENLDQINEKIADYYRRKAEKIENESLLDESEAIPTYKEIYEEKKREYNDLFNSETSGDYVSSYEEKKDEPIEGQENLFAEYYEELEKSIQEGEKDVYQISEDSDLSDYIVSSNIPLGDGATEEIDPAFTYDENKRAEAVVEDIVAEMQEDESLKDINLLNIDETVALNEKDLEYTETEEKEPEKDACFYLSPEDNEKKAIEESKTSQEKIAGIEKEVGDINLNKDIQNAIPSSQLLKEESHEPTDEEMEIIYTLFGMERKMRTKKEEELKVLYVAGECQPFIATGGLGDVAGSLPKAIAKIGGVDIRVILPLYGDIKNEYREKFEFIGNFTVHLSWRQEYCGLFRYFSDGVTYYFVDNERYFKRNKTYGFYDDGERFAYFCKAVVEGLPMLNFFPDVIHCNDWQTALVSSYIKTGNWSDYRYNKIKNVYTIHNVEYQGVYGMENLQDLFGIDTCFRNDMDYNGDINLTKAAIQYSDKFTTVSDSYCDNLKQPYCSRGLHHIVIRNEYKLSGIVNGIDTDFYNPSTDPYIYKNYSVETMEDKVINKKKWQDELGLPVDADTPMIAIVSRLVSHKGLDLVSKMIEDTLQKDVQLVVVGTGDQRFVDYFKYLENKYPTKVRAMVDKYDNLLARKAYAASDIFLMPSKIEPCGISQMISSLYGSVPIVREVGGLKDTITDFGCENGGNGYTFTNYNPNDLAYQLNRAIEDFKDKEGWKKKMKVCMTTDFSWEKSAQKYIDLYKSLMN